MSKNYPMVEFIIYVEDQHRSRNFYEKILEMKPALDVPGMTEFLLNENAKLGIMPCSGIAKILGEKLPNPSLATGIPKCELYLYVDNIDSRFKIALEAGAKLVSKIEKRNWGDKVCYFSDDDGNVIAFAEK